MSHRNNNNDNNNNNSTLVVAKRNSNALRIAESERQLIVITVYILIVSCATHVVVFLFFLSFALGAQNLFAGWLTSLTLFSLSTSFFLNFFIIYFHSRVFRDCLKGIVIRFKR